MTATYAVDTTPRLSHPLRPGASPRDIRSALLLADISAFDTAYQQALRDAQVSLDLTELFRTLEHWRRIALLQHDRNSYRHVVRKAAKLLTGQEIQTDEPLEVTRAKAGM